MNFIKQLYGPFFNINDWQQAFTSADGWLVIFSLAIIECLMSVDNSMVLAAQTLSLPNKNQQDKSLFYGIWGAYIFRFLIIGIGQYLIHFWEIKVIGSVYLFYLSIKYFIDRHKGKNGENINDKKKRTNFWSVVFQIELMDIAFSVDSILAGLAISSKPVMVFIGGIIGISAMRGVAEIIIKLMYKLPELKILAYVLIFFIAIKLIISIPFIGIELPSWLFSLFIVILIILTLLWHQFKRRKF